MQFRSSLPERSRNAAVPRGPVAGLHVILVGSRRIVFGPCRPQGLTVSVRQARCQECKTNFAHRVVSKLISDSEQGKCLQARRDHGVRWSASRLNSPTRVAGCMTGSGDGVGQVDYGTS